MIIFLLDFSIFLFVDNGRYDLLGLVLFIIGIVVLLNIFVMVGIIKKLSVILFDYIYIFMIKMFLGFF